MPTPADLPPVTVIEALGVAPQVPTDVLRARLTNIRGPATTTRVAEITRGDRMLVVVAPWLQEGKLVDDDVVGIVYTRVASGWVAAGEALGLSSGDGRAEAAAALGGDTGWTVTRRCGAPAGELATRANDAIDRFAAGTAAKDVAAAAGAWADFAALWSLPQVAFEDTPTSMLQGATAMGARIACTGVEAPACGLSIRGETLPLRMERCGADWAFGELSRGK